MSDYTTQQIDGDTFWVITLEKHGSDSDGWNTDYHLAYVTGIDKEKGEVEYSRKILDAMYFEDEDNAEIAWVIARQLGEYSAKIRVVKLVLF